MEAGAAGAPQQALAWTEESAPASGPGWYARWARRVARGALSAPALASAVPLAVYAWLRRAATLDMELGTPQGHFRLVTAVSALAAVLAFTVGLTGIRARNHQVLFLALAFTSLAGMFTLHGLATPGMLLHPGHAVSQVAAELSFLFTAGWLYLSSLPSDHRGLRRLQRRPHGVLAAWLAVLALAVAVGLRHPETLERLALDRPPYRWAAAALVVGLCAQVARRYWNSYRYARFPLQGAMALAAGWLAVGQWIAVTGTPWRLSWWLYHVLLLLSAGALVWGWVRQYGTGVPAGAALRDPFAADPVELVMAGISPSVRALVVATEARDPHTAGHSLRVAVGAVLLGRALGLPPEQLRALAQAGVVHDVGKIEIPDHILNKPGPLTPEERRVVERHPVRGYEMCRRLGFAPEELQAIRHHHERWDGSGYPDGLRGEEIPLPARILAVVDVFDALTSERSYRPAWTHEQARQYVLAQAGHHFDPRCARAWAELTAAGPVFPQDLSW